MMTLMSSFFFFLEMTKIIEAEKKELEKKKQAEQKAHSTTDDKSANMGVHSTASPSLSKNKEEEQFFSTGFYSENEPSFLRGSSLTSTESFLNSESFLGTSSFLDKYRTILNPQEKSESTSKTEDRLQPSKNSYWNSSSDWDDLCISLKPKSNSPALGETSSFGSTTSFEIKSFFG